MILHWFWGWIMILLAKTFDLDTWTLKSESDNASKSSFESQEHEEHSLDKPVFNWDYDFPNELKYG